MNPIPLFAALALATAAHAADQAYQSWRPTSTNSVSITGPITITPTSLTVTGAQFPLRLVDMVAKFGPDQGATRARVYEVTKAMTPKLINGNALCGELAPKWVVATPVADGGLEVDVYTTEARPTRQDAPGSCGTFYYKRQ
jgi:hypothetical protein